MLFITACTDADPVVIDKNHDTPTRIDSLSPDTTTNPLYGEISDWNDGGGGPLHQLTDEEIRELMNGEEEGGAL